MAPLQGTVHPQQQSPFFTKLPPEIRARVEIEYLAQHLRQWCIHEGYENRYDCRITVPNRRYSSPLSPLTICCKRMFLEMRCGSSAEDGDKGADGYGPHGNASPGSSFALLFIYRDYFNRQGDPLARVMHLVVEGRFDYERIRHLRFVNEDDHPSEYRWSLLLIQTVYCSKNLTELEVDWNPKMSIMPIFDVVYDHLIWPNKTIEVWYLKSALTVIRDHSALNRIYLRGNVPFLWLEKIPQMQGKQVTIEPILWNNRDWSIISADDTEKHIEKDRQKALEHDPAQGKKYGRRISAKWQSGRQKLSRLRCLIKKL